MKKVYGLVLTLFLFTQNIYSQAFYTTFESYDFKELLKNGLIFLDKGTTQDSIISKILVEKWNACPLKIVKNKKDEKIDDSEFILMYSNEIIVSRQRHLKGMSISPYFIVGNTAENGFGAPKNISLNIEFMNSCINQIIKYKISGRGAGMNSDLQKAVNDKYNKNKILLIVGRNRSFTPTNDKFKKLGIKVQQISEDEFNTIKPSDYKNYYIMYIDNKHYLTYSIYDFEKKEIVVSKRYKAAKIMIGMKLIKKWSKKE